MKSILLCGARARLAIVRFTVPRRRAQERDRYDVEVIEELSARHGFTDLPVLSGGSGNIKCRTRFRA